MRVDNCVPLDDLLSEDVWGSVEDDLGCVRPSLNEALVGIENTFLVGLDSLIQHFYLIITKIVHPGIVCNF